MYGCESWIIKKIVHQIIGVYKLWCWRRLLRVPWTERRSNQSFLKEINFEYSLEGLIVKLRLLYFWLPDMKNRLIGKGPDPGKSWVQEEKGVVEDVIVGYHHQFNGHEFEQTPGESEGQRSLACCSPWVAKSQTQLSNWSDLIWSEHSGKLSSNYSFSKKTKLFG